MPADPVSVVLEFERLINLRKPAGIVGMLTDDSMFVDSLGATVQGRERLRAAWEGYFKMVPDYMISHEEIFSHGQTVVMFGSACGTFAPGGRMLAENFWEAPAAWRAIVRDGQISFWQVYVDNEPIRAIMRKNA